jgi:DNA-binding response OmpR family regulator
VRVLLVEDDESIARFIEKGLREAGFAIEHVTDGLRAFAFATSAPFDLIVLDVLIPKLNGFELLQDLRENDIKTPILMLTAKNAIEDRVKGLNSGADDYLTKPFSFDELIARIHALLRRPPLQSGSVLKAGALTMDTVKREVTCFGTIVDLRPKEYALLEYFMRHPNQVLTRTQIGEHVWNLDFYNESNVIDVYIGILRKKIETGSCQLIHTVRGVGYRFAEDGIDV